MKGLAEIDGQYYIFSEDDGTLQKGENVPYGGYTYGCLLYTSRCV